jgi:alkylation response protein AidB-like acyl-CoA dehydrogenase
MSETMTKTVPDSAEEVLTAVEELGPELASRAAETEAGRRLPPDLVGLLVDNGCFRMLLPRSHGGVEGTLADQLHLVEGLARADGSVGWTVMIGSSAWADMVHLPRATFDELFAEPGTIVAGAISPSGSAESLGAEGFRVTGRWGFVTGVEHATWVGLNCLQVDDAGGPPGMRLAVLPREQVVVEDTWHVSGLRGTGSQHVRAEGVEVATTWTCEPMTGEPCVDLTIARVPAPALVALLVSRVALGIAAGALDDITMLATDKVPLLSPGTLATSPTFHRDLATADARLRSARALHDDTAGAVWTTAMSGGTFTNQERARARLDAVWAVEQAVDVVELAYRAGGGTALYDGSPLQRRLRDVHAVTQHFIVRPDVLAAAGSVLAGQEPPGPVF